MKLNQDQLVEGPFGSNACYEQSFEQQGTADIKHGYALVVALQLLL